MAGTTCFHCGDTVVEHFYNADKSKSFCCNGCLTVFDLLNSSHLGNYYSIENSPGLRIDQIRNDERFAILDDQAFAQQFIQFQDDHITKVTFHLPQIHCSSCIWLLENLSRLNPGVVNSLVSFTKRTADITFENNIISLRQVVELLASIGYVPDLKRKEEAHSRSNKKLIFQIGIAGFCFGNIMLLSFPEYLGLDESAAEFQRFFSWISMLLAFPVMFYSGLDYLKSAVAGLRQRFINMDVPIALGMLTLFGRSGYEVLSGTGVGYFDSLAGLVFFLLIGKWFQQKTYSALSFERDYKSYFPIAVQRIQGGEKELVRIEELSENDVVQLRNNELIPADGILKADRVLVDYSFVTGESDAVSRGKGDVLYAGGRIIGAMVSMKLTRKVDNSYLTKLWNQDVFQKERPVEDLNSVSNKVSKYFTVIVLLITLFTAVYWQLIDPSVTFNAVTAVLIVACPCALALSVPFTYGNLTRFFGRVGFYLKNAQIIETMAKVDTVVMDKTGTITYKDTKHVVFVGADLASDDKELIHACCSNSVHPLSVSIKRHLVSFGGAKSSQFEELSGKGLTGEVDGKKLRLGSQEFIGCDVVSTEGKSQVHVEINGEYKGYFSFEQRYREGMDELINTLSNQYKLHLLSGDVRSQAETVKAQFTFEEAHFEQSPQDKLSYIAKLQDEGKVVLMLGDGLNDAGALKQSDVGISVSDDVSQFTPACSAILNATKLKQMARFLSLANASRKIVVLSFTLSFMYNIVGLAFAVSGQLSPVFAAILMPLSSISVVALTTLAVRSVTSKMES